MNKRTLRILEYNKILEMLTEHAASSMAKKRIMRMKPSRDIEEIRQYQSETRDALLRISYHGNVSFAGLRDVGESLKLLEINSALNAPELLNIASLLETADHVKSYGDKGPGVPDNQEKGPDTLSNRFDDLRALRDISSEIRRCIISDEEMADDASSHLKSLRRDMVLTNERLHSELSKMIKNGDNQSYLQDNLITMRNGRYCIPVKQEYRYHFPGMIHDQSKTGSTLFIEPMAIVNINNKLKELATEEQVEIEKILTNLSQIAASCVEDITINMKVLTELDFIFAKAKFAKSMNASEPTFNEEGHVNLKSARHPLLEKHKVVPIDLSIGNEYTLLIVTGPNTGGKTVSLKTLGLLTLMGQSGLHIPADYGSTLSVFSDVFADIGDEQSIEQNLSTFSSHMSNIVYIVNHASKDTLCLFDEPGGGTDPVEGAALAISILSYLKDMGAICMATTHYTELKTFALSTPMVMNASCEFDVATLMPTYKLMIGIPGKSNAFAISKKLGLPELIIETAKSSIEQSSVDMENIIASLVRDKQKMEEDRFAAECLRNEAEALKKELARKEKELDKKKSEIIDKARVEAREIIDDAKDEADAAIRDINRWKADPGRTNASDMEKKRAKLREKQKSLEGQTKKKRTEKSSHKSGDFTIGDSVEVISMDQIGTVAELPNSKGLVGVRLGILTMNFPISDLIIVESAEEIAKKTPKTQAKTGASVGMSKAMNFKPEINLLGMTVSEALAALEKFLDDALISHVSSVRVVHGKGTGALRKGVHEYLRKQKFVKSYRLGEYGEGDAGVTIVEL